MWRNVTVCVCVEECDGVCVWRNVTVCVCGGMSPLLYPMQKLIVRTCGLLLL